MTERSESTDPVYMTPREASRIASVSTRTLSRLADAGALKIYQLPSGHRRYLRSDVERLTQVPALTQEPESVPAA